MICLEPFPTQPSEVITHLVHLSDIHIRLDCTFEKEYSHVFASTLIHIERIASQFGNARCAIVITGDFFHVKDRLSPTSETLAVGFLKSLSRIARVILILGNHDVIIQNSKVMLDTISSVLSERDTLNIVYIKESGVYRFRNLILIHNSVLDSSTDNWIHSKGEWRRYTEDRIVHLYHGQVESCTMDNGCRLSSPIKVGHFQGADASLLGDIHRHQFLSGNIAYAGSLICQNIGEAVYSHGFLLWDIHKVPPQTTFVKIPNEYQTIRVDVLQTHHIRYRQRDFSDLEELVLKFKKYGTMKKTQSVVVYVSPEATLTDMEIRDMFHRHVSRHVSIKHHHKPLKQISLQNVNDDDKTMERQLEDFISARSASLPRPVSHYLNLIFDHWDTSVGGSTVCDIQFKSLSFSYMFGYGKDNTITFNGSPCKPVIRMVSGKNSVGKSSIIDILTFVLFNRITRYASGNKIPKEVIHEKQSRASVRLVFLHGSDKYEIFKHMERAKPVKMCLKKNDQNITQAVRQTTEKLILTIFGTFECFLNSHVCLQRQTTKTFKDKTPKEQKEELFQLCQVDKFETVYKKFHEAYNRSCTESLLTETAMTACPHYSEKDVMSMLSAKESLDREYASSSQTITSLESRVQDIHHANTKIEMYERQVRDLQSKRGKCSQDNSNPLTLAELQDMISKLEYERQKYSDELSCNHREHKKIMLQLKQYNNQDLQFDFPFYTRRGGGGTSSSAVLDNVVFPFDISYPRDDEKMTEYITALVDELGIYESDVLPKLEKCLELHREYSRLADKGAFLKEQVDLHEAAKYSTDCECCMTNPFRAQKVELLSQLHTNTADVSSIVKAFHDVLPKCVVDQGEDGIETFDTSVFSKHKTAYKTLSGRLSSLKHVHQRYRNSFETFMSCRCTFLGVVCRNRFLERSIERIRSELEKYRSCLIPDHGTIIEIEKDIQAKVRELRSTIQEGRITHLALEDEKKKNKRLVEERAITKIKLQEALEHTEKWKVLKEKWTRIEAEKKEWKALKEICHSDGFPLFFIKNSLAVLEEDMNRVVEHFIDRKVRFAYENDILIFQTKCHSDQDGLNYYGGMESFLLDVAVKVVFSKYAKISKPSLFILDENISVLDEERLRNIDSLFDFLRQFFSDILIISHQPFLLNVVDDVMSVEKDDEGFSAVH